MKNKILNHYTFPMINPNLCEHTMKFATVVQRTGKFKPLEYAILYCEKCGKLFNREIKV